MTELYAKAWTNGNGRTRWQPVSGRQRLWKDVPVTPGEAWREYGNVPFLTSRRKAVRMGRRKAASWQRHAWTEADTEGQP